jgi:hypothetical protein
MSRRNIVLLGSGLRLRGTNNGATQRQRRAHCDNLNNSIHDALPGFIHALSLKAIVFTGVIMLRRIVRLL